MAGVEAAINLVVEETSDPSSPAPILVQRPDDGPTVLAAGSFSKPVQPPRTPDSSLSREQVTPILHVHPAAAESRVCNALHQVIESIEKKLLGALRQAAIDIIDNLGKEAAEYILLSQRKAAMLEYELNYTKEHALSLLMQVRRVSDAQISAAENKVLIERRRAQEAEANLQTMQESNKKLKAELKRKGQQVEEFQRITAIAQQSLRENATEGTESRKGGNRFKSVAGDKKTQQISDARNEEGALAMQPEVTTFDRSASGITEVQTDDGRNPPLVHSLTDPDGHNTTRVEKGVFANRVFPQERSNLQVTGTCHVKVSKLEIQQGSPTNQSASVAGVDNMSAKELQPHSSSEGLHATATQGEVSPSLTEKGQRNSCLKTDLELRSAKDSDEEKSSLTVEALYCNDESLPPQLHPGDEYQSNKTRDHIEPDTLDTAGGLSSGGKRYSREADISIHCTEELEMDEDPDRASTFLPNTSRFSTAVRGDDKGPSSQVFQLPGGITEKVHDGFETREKTSGSEKVGQESKETTEGVHAVVADDKPVLRKAEASPLTGDPDSDEPSDNVQVVKSDSNSSGINLPNQDVRRPEAQTESLDNLVSKKKRKQGATVSKYDLLVTERSSKRLEADGAVTPCDLLTAAGVDTHISSRDSRRLMQGARQLCTLAEGKWR